MLWVTGNLPDQLGSTTAGHDPTSDGWLLGSNASFTQDPQHLFQNVRQLRVRQEQVTEIRHAISLRVTASATIARSAATPMSLIIEVGRYGDFSSLADSAASARSWCR
jgi:hypothetical protein